MTSSLSNILNEMVSKLVNEGVAMFVQIDSNVEDQVEILRQWASSSPDYSEDQCYSMAGYSLRLWDETLICDHEPRFILEIQELVFDLIRSLRQPQFLSAEWLQIKSEIALTLGKKYAKLKSNDDITKAVTCFEYVENQCDEIDDQMSTMVEHKIRSMLAHIETVHGKDFENASKINDRLQLLLTSQNRSSVLAAVTFYNVGWNLFRRRQHQQAVYWLNSSLEHGVNSEHKDDICCLLTDAYLALDGNKYWEKAQEALNNVEKDENNEKWNLLHIKVLLANPSPPLEQLKCALNNCHAVSHMATIMECLMRPNYKSLALEICDIWIKQTLNQLQSSPDNSHIHLKILEYQVQLLLEVGQLSEAETALQSYLAIDGARTTIVMLDVVEREVHRLRAEQNYNETIEWLNYCIKLSHRLDPGLETTMEQRLTNYYQQICSCHVQLNDWQAADDSLTTLEDEVDDCNQLLTKCLKLQICIGRGDHGGALNVAALICEQHSSLKQDDDLFHMLMGCVKFGFKISQISITMSLLEQVIDNIDSNNTKVQLMELLLKLKLTSKSDHTNEEEPQWFERFGNKLLNQLQRFQLENDTLDDVKAKWFVKVLWNVAHSNQGNRLLVHTVLKWANRVLSVCDTCNSISLVLQRKTCILLSVVAGVQAVRWTTSKDNLSVVLSLIEEFRQLDISNIPATEKASRSADQVISLYEFEAKSALDSPDLDQMFEKCLATPEADAKYYESLATISCKNKQLWSMKCIRMAIDGLLKQAEPRYPQIYQLYHSLIALILTQIESKQLQIIDLEAAMQDIENLIQNATEDKHKVSQTEIAWFASKCWNLGVSLVNEDREGARKCCMAAMRLALHLGVDYHMYLEKMNKAYPIMMKKSWSVD